MCPEGGRGAHNYSKAWQPCAEFLCSGHSATGKKETERKPEEPLKALKSQLGLAAGPTERAMPRD